MDPLTKFVWQGVAAPYMAERPECDVRAMVVKVRSKTGIVAAAKRGAFAHYDNGVAGFIENGRMRLAARFLCGGGSNDVLILSEVDTEVCGGICVLCADAKLGPAVYRCHNASGRVIYIGSSEAPLKRRRSHESRTPWWPEVADVQVQRYPTIFEARAAERIAIDTEKPLYNKPRNSPRKRRAVA